MASNTSTTTSVRPTARPACCAGGITCSGRARSRAWQAGFALAACFVQYMRDLRAEQSWIRPPDRHPCPENGGGGGLLWLRLRDVGISRKKPCRSWGSLHL